MPLKSKLLLFNFFAVGALTLCITGGVVLVVFRTPYYIVFLGSGWISLALMWMFLPDADDFLRDIRAKRLDSEGVVLK